MQRNCGFISTVLNPTEHFVHCVEKPSIPTSCRPFCPCDIFSTCKNSGFNTHCGTAILSLRQLARHLNRFASIPIIVLTSFLGILLLAFAKAAIRRAGVGLLWRRAWAAIVAIQRRRNWAGPDCEPRGLAAGRMVSGPLPRSLTAFSLLSGGRPDGKPCNRWSANCLLSRRMAGGRLAANCLLPSAFQRLGAGEPHARHGYSLRAIPMPIQEPE